MKKDLSPSGLSNKLTQSMRCGRVLWVALAAAVAPILTPTPLAWADRFANRFIEFELPPQWNCSLEQAEWVCQSSEQNKKRDAIIILAAKLKGDNDGLEPFLNYLKQPKSYTSAAGKAIVSEPKYAQQRELNGHVWADALHNDSEIPGFITRYLATTKEDIAVLVTYSIVKNKYQDYLSDFESMVKTLKVFRQAGGLNSSGDAAGAAGSGILSSGISEGTVFPNLGGFQDNSGDSKKSGQSSEEELPWVPIAAAVGALLFIAWRRKQSRK